VLSGVSMAGCWLPSRVPFWADVWDAEIGVVGGIDGIGGGVKGGVKAVIWGWWLDGRLPTPITHGG
jgi:hypothetical protein